MVVKGLNHNRYFSFMLMSTLSPSKTHHILINVNIDEVQLDEEEEAAEAGKDERHESQPQDRKGLFIDFSLLCYY